VPDAVRRGRLGIVGGRFAASPAEAVAAVGQALAEVGLSLADLVKLGVFYLAGGDEPALLEAIAESLGDRPGPALSVVPVPWLAAEGAELLVEAVAVEGERSVVAGSGARFATAVRSGELLWTSALTASEAPGEIVGQTELVLDRLRSAVGELGCELDDAVKVNIYYAGTGTVEDWEVAAKVRGAAFREPAAAATGIPIPRFADERVLTSIELWAMRGEDGRSLPREHFWPEGHWDWPIHLPWKHGCRCGGLAFVGGQVSLRGFGEVVDPGELATQTRTAMANIGRVLAGFGASLDDVIKLTAFYERRGAALSLDPGRAAATVVALPYLAYREMVVEIEAIAAVGA
jgi:enamine deaminase RidA (YjgF/YER057c/UK114 family)